jgi:hypothetical protein
MATTNVRGNAPAGETDRFSRMFKNTPALPSGPSPVLAMPGTERPLHHQPLSQPEVPPTASPTHLHPAVALDDRAKNALLKLSPGAQAAQPARSASHLTENEFGQVRARSTGPTPLHLRGVEPPEPNIDRAGSISELSPTQMAGFNAEPFSPGPGPRRARGPMDSPHWRKLDLASKAGMGAEIRPTEGEAHGGRVFSSIDAMLEARANPDRAQALAHNPSRANIEEPTKGGTGRMATSLSNRVNEELKTRTLSHQVGDPIPEHPANEHLAGLAGNIFESPEAGRAFIGRAHEMARALKVSPQYLSPAHLGTVTRSLVEEGHATTWDYANTQAARKESFEKEQTVKDRLLRTRGAMESRDTAAALLESAKARPTSPHASPVDLSGLRGSGRFGKSGMPAGYPTSATGLRGGADAASSGGKRRTVSLDDTREFEDTDLAKREGGKTVYTPDEIRNMDPSKAEEHLSEAQLGQVDENLAKRVQRGQTRAASARVATAVAEGSDPRAALKGEGFVPGFSPVEETVGAGRMGKKVKPGASSGVSREQAVGSLSHEEDFLAGDVPGHEDVYNKARELDVRAAGQAAAVELSQRNAKNASVAAKHALGSINTSRALTTRRRGEMSEAAENRAQAGYVQRRNSVDTLAEQVETASAAMSTAQALHGSRSKHFTDALALHTELSGRLEQATSEPKRVTRATKVVSGVGAKERVAANQERIRAEGSVTELPAKRVASQKPKGWRGA